MGTPNRRGIMNNSVYMKGLAVVLIIAIIIMAAMGIKLSGKEKEIAFNYSLIEQDEETNKESNEYIYVDIDGAVINPGVYELLEGSRVIDAINKAGGLEEKAFTQNLNKARKLIDGEKIYIYIEGDEYIKSLQSNNLININIASVDALMSLPGIGEVYANRIIEYRYTKKFSSIEEIKNIEGIGDKTFEKLKELITVN
jgi:competence protein ComEA